MKKLLLVLFVLLAACSTAPQIQVVEVTRVVAPTEVPTPRPSPTPRMFDPGRNWTHSPEFNTECYNTCETWLFYDGELIAQVYPDGIAFGIFMVGTGDATEEGEALAMAALAYGVPMNVVELAGDDIANGAGAGGFGAWAYDVTLDDDLLIVSFVHDGPVNSRVG